MMAQPFECFTVCVSGSGRIGGVMMILSSSLMPSGLCHSQEQVDTQLLLRNSESKLAATVAKTLQSALIQSSLHTSY